MSEEMRRRVKRRIKKVRSVGHDGRREELVTPPHQQQQQHCQKGWLPCPDAGLPGGLKVANSNAILKLGGI